VSFGGKRDVESRPGAHSHAASMRTTYVLRKGALTSSRS
jgi:hypothetical protein